MKLVAFAAQNVGKLLHDRHRNLGEELFVIAAGRFGAFAPGRRVAPRLLDRRTKAPPEFGSLYSHDADGT